MDMTTARTQRPRALVSACLALALLLLSAPTHARERATPAQLASAREYVRRGWRTLSRSNRHLLNAAIDPKFRADLLARQNVPAERLRWPVYVSRKEDFAAVERYYDYWAGKDAPHLTPTGLSRYYDLGEGPAPEVVADERDARGRTHYDRVKEFYRTHADPEDERFYDRRNDRLTPDFYKGDRSMRESGFDPSNRFGRFGADVTRYTPVCLNSLLYVYERDAGRPRVLETGGVAVPR